MDKLFKDVLFEKYDEFKKRLEDVKSRDEYYFIAGYSDNKMMFYRMISATNKYNIDLILESMIVPLKAMADHYGTEAKIIVYDKLYSAKTMSKKLTNYIKKHPQEYRIALPKLHTRVNKYKIYEYRQNQS